jgi:1-pyrroline-5-carboxylate dehydrogenase
MKSNFLEQIEAQAAKRTIKNLSIGPVLTWNNKQIKAHIDAILELEGSKVLFGGEPITEQHSIPEIYGSFKPTAVYVPLKHFRQQKKFKLLTTELFGPFQVVTDYSSKDLDFVLEIFEGMSHHLTAAVVSNDPIFTEQVLASTVNGTTYAGIRARTTGAP